MGEVDLGERARRVLLHEQRTKHEDVAVKPGGLALFFTRWSADATNSGHPYAQRLGAMFGGYGALDPMQRAAHVRAALALLASAEPTPPVVERPKAAARDGNFDANSSDQRVGGMLRTPSAQQATSTQPQTVVRRDASSIPPIARTTQPTPLPTPITPATKLPSTKPTLTPTPIKKGAAALNRPSNEPVGEYLLDAPVTVVSGVGPALASKFERVGIKTVRDLLYYLPREHHDYSQLQKIAELPFDETVTLLGVIWEVENVRSPNGRSTRTIARISDETGEIRAVWFNQPYLQKQLTRGAQIVLTGVKQRFGNAVQLTAKSHELPEQGDLVNTGRLVPIYPLTEGLNAKALRRATKWVIDRCAGLVTDYLPVAVRQSAQLMPLQHALAQYHYPEDVASLDEARHRLAFDEMFIVQLGMLARRGNWHIGPPAPVITVERGRIFAGEPALAAPLVMGGTALLPPTNGLWGDTITAATCFEDSLPFAFTAAQRRVIAEALTDMATARPMCRLVQGDVGSGKTAVAAAAMLAAALAGYQAAIMAPTEILAEKHARSLTKMFAPFGIEVATLLGSQKTKQRAEALAAIESGRARIVVGTHALIQESVVFARLGLAVVDEQHRFGVEQREALRRKANGISPHLLVMTATPIPRTLALAVYGDLDLSVIDQMPAGRKPVITRWRAGSRREEAVQQMGWEVAQGRQGYIICPLIEESETLEARAAVAEFERLRKEVFPEQRMGLVHGALKTAEKDATMRKFRDGEIDILVATAVVEVGVDVPNATIMLIEDADRFGLAQLHQFRGRVGRGEHQSYCYLLSQDASATARERLIVVEGTTDGFKLAEADLRLRGPGEFFGTRQSGLPELRVADLMDGPLITEARREAEAIWERDPFLKSSEHSPLRERVAIFWQNYMAQ